MTPIELRCIRKTLQLTQEELAQRLGVETNTVARWERGERPISQTTELAMNYLAETGLRLGDGYRADIDSAIRLHIEMGPAGKEVAIYDHRKRKTLLSRGRPSFSFETGLEPNLAVFQRFAMEEAFRLSGRKTRPTDDDVLAVEWKRQ